MNVLITSSVCLWASKYSVWLTAPVHSSAVGTMRSVYPFGGSVMVSLTVVMAQMNLRLVLLDTVPSVSSSVRTGTAPIQASSATVTRTVPTTQTRTLPSAVTTGARITSSSVKTRTASPCRGTVMGLRTVRMAVTRTPTAALRGRVNRDSSSAPMDSVSLRATCVMPKMTVEMGPMNPLKPAWVQVMSVMKLSSPVKQTTAVSLCGLVVTAPMTAWTTVTSRAVRR